MDDVVEFLRRNAGDHVRSQRVEDLGREPAGAAHAFEAFWAVELDGAVLGFDAIVGGDGDILSHEP